MDKYIGQTLDNRYEILEVIGVGGMAVVYKTRCHRLNRLVALKILKDEFAQDAEFRRRFHAESQAVAMLSHPNIVAVHDVSRSNNVEYIVMELIDGITLKQYMQKKGTLNWREALHFATQIAKALSHAHGRGIIHRDIKPHNIMILRDGSVKVADFGIARFASKQNTLTQEALGSVHYISPEQAKGSHIDARSDIYSLGVVMYEMLTDRLPYEGDSPVSVAIQHINSIPLTPREVNAEIPEALETITMKAMSATLSKRYGSAEMLLHDLEEFRKNPSISFDYDIDDLMSKSNIDEPTKALTSGVGAVAVVGKGKRPSQTEKEDEMYRIRQRNRTITTLTGVLSVFIFVAAMFYLVWSLWFGSNSSGDPNDAIETVAVPPVVGLEYEKVTQEQSDVRFVIEKEEFSSLYAKGVITAQDPSGNTQVKKDTPVKLTVSKGANLVPIPNVAGLDYRQAQKALGDLGLKYDVNPAWEVSEDVVKDYVIRTDPAVGTEAKAGDYIVLFVSKGPDVKMVAMMKLEGKPIDEAQRLMDHANLILTQTMVDSAKPAGEVVWQSIKSGEEIEEKTEVQVQVSLGPLNPEPSPSASPDTNVSPSPTDVTPTPSGEPTPVATPSPADDLITVPVIFPLPTDTAVVKVEIRKNGVVIDTREVNTSTLTYSHSVTGNPADIIEILINGNIQYTRELRNFQ